MDGTNEMLIDAYFAAKQRTFSPNTLRAYRCSLYSLSSVFGAKALVNFG